MSARVAVVVFPGTNCEHDTVESLAELGATAELVWHQRETLAGYDAVVLPGGFAHGDYLRPGAIARFSPVMGAIGDLAAQGAPVVGICNGFQVLTEAGLLPGALQRNAGRRFVCRPVVVEVVRSGSALTRHVVPGTRLTLPVNHFSGNFTCEAHVQRELEASGQVVLRYLDNPNGSVGDIAAVSNEAGNVVGLMPHPERATSRLLGSSDGAILLSSLLEAAGQARVPTTA